MTLFSEKKKKIKQKNNGKKWRNSCLKQLEHYISESVKCNDTKQQLPPNKYLPLCLLCSPLPPCHQNYSPNFPLHLLYHSKKKTRRT